VPSDTSDYLRKRAQELGLGRADVLATVQAWLDEQWPAQARAISLNDGVLRIQTKGASLSSELRMRQQEIKALVPEAERVAISPNGS
jgi:hypothetical protein